MASPQTGHEHSTSPLHFLPTGPAVFCSPQRTADHSVSALGTPTGGMASRPACCLYRSRNQTGTLLGGKGSEIYRWINFLVTAVPKCFSGESFRLYREEQRREAADRPRPREREAEERLADPLVPEEDQHLIRECLGF